MNAENRGPKNAAPQQAVSPDYRVVPGPDYEPSAWMRDRLTERLAEVRRRVPGGLVDTVLIPLGEGHARPGTIEDRTCDRCRRYVGKSHSLYLAIQQPAPDVCVTGGLCSDCAKSEGWVP